MAAAMEIDDEIPTASDKSGSKKRFEVKKVVNIGLFTYHVEIRNTLLTVCSTGLEHWNSLCKRSQTELVTLCLA